MAYSKLGWTNSVSPLSAARFNHMEDGIEAAHALAADLAANKEDAGVAQAAADSALAAAQAYADGAVASGVVTTVVHPQRLWDPVTSTWQPRPAVPPGIVVRADSWFYPAATPPDGALHGDEWKAAPTSIYRP